MKLYTGRAVIVSLAAIALLWAACAKVPFTQTFKTQALKTDSAAVEKIQFYIGNTIVLERTTQKPVDTTVVVGKVGFENGIYTQIVRIDKGTLAICKNQGPTRQIAVVGPGPNEQLPFVSNSGVYMLDAFKGKVMYAGLEFRVVKGASAQLMVSPKTVAPEKTITKAKGMKLVVDKAAEPKTDE